jgi:hypothetical protein
MYTKRQKEELHEIIRKIWKADSIRDHFNIDGDKIKTNQETSNLSEIMDRAKYPMDRRRKTQ